MRALRQLVVAGVRSIQGQVHGRGLVLAGVLVGELGAGLQAHLIPRDQALQRTGADGGGGAAVIDLAGHAGGPGRDRLGADRCLGIGLIAAEYIVAGIRAPQRQRADLHGLVAAHILVGKAGAATQAQRISRDHAAEAAGQQFGAAVAVIDLVGHLQAGAVEAARGDDANIGTHALAAVAIDRHIAGLGAGRDAHRVDRHGFAIARVFVVVHRLGAAPSEAVAIDGAAELQLVGAQRGGVATVIDLADRAAELRLQHRRHQVEHAIALAQHGAGRAGVVLFEGRRQTTAHVLTRIARVNAPSAISGLNAIAAGVVDEVAPGLQAQRHGSRGAIAGDHGLVQNQIAADARGAQVYAAAGAHAIQAVGAAHDQAAVVDESQIADLGGKLAHRMGRAALHQLHSAAAAQGQLGRRQHATARNACTGLLTQRQGIGRADSLIQLQAALGSAQEQAAAAGAECAVHAQALRLDVDLVLHRGAEAMGQHLIVTGQQAQGVHASELGDGGCAQLPPRATDVHRALRAPYAEFQRAAGLAAQHGALSIKAAGGLQLQAAIAVVERQGRVQAQAALGLQLHRRVAAGLDRQAVQAIDRAQPPARAAQLLHLGVAAHIKRQGVEVKTAAAQCGTGSSRHGDPVGRYATIDAHHALATLQMHRAGRGRDVAVKNQIAAVTAPHFKRGCIDLTNGGAVQPGAQMQLIGGRHLAQRDLARAVVGSDGLADVDGVAGEGQTACGISQGAGRNVHGLVDHFEVAAGVEAEVAAHADRAGAVFAPDGQVFDARQLGQGGSRSKAAGIAHHHIGGFVKGLQAQRSGGEVVQRGGAPVDRTGAQCQHARAGVQGDWHAAEADAAVGEDAGAALEGEGCVDVDVTSGIDLAGQHLGSVGLVASVGRVFIVKVQAPAAQTHIGVQRDAIVARRDIEVAAARADGRIQREASARHRIRVGPQTHIAAMCGDGAAHRDAVGSKQGNGGISRCAAAHAAHIVAGQCGDVGARAMRNQIGHIADHASAGTARHHHDAAGAKDLDGVVLVGKIDVAAGPPRFHTQAHIGLHADLAVAAVLREIAEVDVTAGLQQHIGGLGFQVFFEDFAAVDGTAARAALDCDGGRIQQEIPGAPMRCPRIGAAAVGQLLLARDFGAATVARLCTAAHLDAACELRAAIRPEHHLTAIAVQAAIGQGLDACIRGETLGIAVLGIFALPSAAHMDLAAASGAAGVQARALAQGQMLARNLNLAASAGLAVNIQAAAQAQLAVATAVQHNTAALLAQAAGFDHTAAVDHAGAQGAGGLRAELHHAALGMDLGLQRRAFHLEAQQTVAIQVQADLFARAQQAAAAGAVDLTAVVHLRRDQRHIASVGAAESAGVLHLARSAAAAEASAPGQEVAVRNRQRAGHQAPHIDLSRAAKHHPVRVEQPDLTVRLQAAEDGAGLAAGDAVQCHALRAGLLKAHLCIAPDLELAPIHDQLVAALLHTQLAGQVLHQLGLARDDAAAAGQGQGRRRLGGRGLRLRTGGQGGPQHQGAGGPLATAAGVLGHGDKGLSQFIPDQAVGVVQGSGFLGFHGV